MKALRYGILAVVVVLSGTSSAQFARRDAIPASDREKLIRAWHWSRLENQARTDRWITLSKSRVR